MKGVRWVAAWAAAYALVFQLVLTSAAVAGLPRDANLNILCLNAASAADPARTDGKTTPLGIHCPACLARIDLAAPSAPVAVPLVVRKVVIVSFRPIARPPLHAPVERGPLQARAPPLAA